MSIELDRDCCRRSLWFGCLLWLGRIIHSQVATDLRYQMWLRCDKLMYSLAGLAIVNYQVVGQVAFIHYRVLLHVAFVNALLRQ